MGALFNFNTLITPRVMKLLFFVGVIVSGLGSLGVIGAGLTYARMLGGGGMSSLFVVIVAIVMFFVGVIASRVSCECILVMFMIRSELAHMRQTLAPAASPSNQ